MRIKFQPLVALMPCLVCQVLCLTPLVMRSADKIVPLPGKLVELPPYVVEEPLTPPWRYATIPGVEVVARCPDTFTRQLIQRQYRLHELLKILVPEDLTVIRDLPRYYVFYHAENQPPVNLDIVTSIEKQEQSAAESGRLNRRSEPNVQVGFMPNFRFWDEDSLAIFFVVDPVADNRDGITLSAGYVRYLLETRTPMLPRWYIEGLMELYASVDMTEPPLQTSLDVMAATNSLTGPVGPKDEIKLAPTNWIGGEVTANLRQNVKAKPNILPLAQVITPPPQGERDAAFEVIWRAESALFIRWALDPGRKHPNKGQLAEQPAVNGVPPRKAALWDFVRRSSVEPATETVFKECFGLSYAEVTEQMQNYLQSALTETITLRSPRAIAVPPINLRDATAGEVGRIKGELSRLEVNYVRELYPDLTPRYLEQARRSLRSAYDKGDRDPQLLASLGLCETDAGQDDAALPFLRAAVEAGVVRPSAYFELARLEFAKLTAERPDYRPTPDEIAPILALLAKARTQSPKIPAVYELYTTILIRSNVALRPKALANLDEAVRLFPRRVRLLQLVAILQAMNSNFDVAKQLIVQALLYSADPAQRQKLSELRAAIAKDETGL